MAAGKPLNRRAFLGALSSLPLLGAGQTLPPDRSRYADPATEFNVVRLTDPAYNSYLPVSQNRPVSRSGGFLVHASDRSGTLQLMRLDLKNGESSVLTEASTLLPWSVTLMPNERAVSYVSGNQLFLQPISNRKSRVLYELQSGFECTGLSVSEDGNHAFLTEQGGEVSRLRIVPLLRGSAATILEGRGRFLDPAPRPRRAGVLYRRGDGSIWLVNYDGQQNRRLPAGPGRVVRALWSANGRAVLYLSVRDEPKRIHAIRECVPDTNADSQVAITSQYADFDRNSDGTVFIGASDSKAQPFILLMVRAVRREFTLCEHKASDARMVSPQFSPSSQRIYFQSDRGGKPAIYTMAVERLVETTES
jgi:oligogalacturonide lyase